MISIVVHGIIGTAYRQDIVVDGGAVANGDVKVLHDIRTYLYGMVFCGKGLLTADRDYPLLDEESLTESQNQDKKEDTNGDTFDEVMEPIETKPLKTKEIRINPPVYGPPIPTEDMECVYGPPIVKHEGGRKARMFRNIFSSHGRIRRLEYGLTQVFSIVYYFLWAFLGVYYIEIVDNGIAVFVLLWLVLFLLPIWVSVVQGVKRCHDIGYSGWQRLMPSFLIKMCFEEGEDRDNEYGANPKGPSASAEPIANMTLKRVMSGIWIAAALAFLIVIICNIRC